MDEARPSPEPPAVEEKVAKIGRSLVDEIRARWRFTVPTEVQMTARIVFHET